MRLDFRNGDAIGSHRLIDGELLVGWGPACGLHFDAGGVAETHARFKIDDRFIVVFEVDPKAPITVNGSTVEKQILNPGDEIRLGVVTLSLRELGDPEPKSVAKRRRLGEDDPNAGILGRYRLRRLDNRQPYILAQLCETIGAQQTNSLMINAPGIERYHARLDLSEGTWIIKDLESPEGVYYAPSLELPQERVAQQQLNPDCLIKIGSIEFIFELAQAEEAMARDPEAVAREKQNLLHRRLVIAGGVVVIAFLTAVAKGGGLILALLLFYHAIMNREVTWKTLVLALPIGFYIMLDLAGYTV